jgi:hypothetical protein
MCGVEFWSVPGLRATSHSSRVGLNIPQIELLAICVVGGKHCVIVTKLCGAQIFGVGGFKHPYDIVPTNHTFGCFLRSLGSKGRAREFSEAMVRADLFVSVSPDPFKPTLTAKDAPKKAPQITPQNTYLFLCMLLRGRFSWNIVSKVFEFAR